ncbi:A/G-specific adenine glycosylase MutY [Helicobacter sp. NHP19-003]|uniref:Adenine DNA glycosylase n=1 Tax=Helicobacter gastrocanis TaxID=2849641 RepID=A0ABN6I362_9HELI|nr:A/G-specific adenine glycosylase [Helicobacter sp. NHP19-003]BCZ18026.1 A/G-specific adenine glycosylase MutY [Helicobacter sp. NHP19-003]
MFEPHHNALLKWYATSGRIDLPIRHLKGANAPYEVYVSEIMSQQTQIGVVLDKFYPPFLKAMPTLKALARAKLEQVLLLWQGLGYYARAKNLHKSAQICCEKHGGQLPNDYQALRALPGVGDYTANAILCFGYKQAVGVVDANVSRVLLRLFALDPKSPNLAKLLQAKALEFLNLDNPFDHNQALIDLGALVCTPANPACLLCPLQQACKGKHDLKSFSVAKKPPSTPITKHYGVCLQGGFLYLSCAKKGLYAHLHQIPLLKEQEQIHLPLLAQVRHSYTKYRLSAKIYEATLADLDPTDLVKIPLKDFKNTPKSALSLKIMDALPHLKF